MLKINYILGFCLALVLTSCSKDDYMLYDDVDKIQFGPSPDFIYRPDYQLLDTMKSFSFSYSPASVKQDTIFVDIYTMGKVSKIDRPFKLKQVNVDNLNNAMPGIHYKAFNDPSILKHYVIKAGSVHELIPIVLLRDASLKTKQIILKIEVEGNEHFGIGEKAKIWRKLIFSDKLVRPNLWNFVIENYYFGKYSEVKHQWMIEQTGKRWDNEFMDMIMKDFSETIYWRDKLSKLLAEYNGNPSNPNVPLKDEFGDLIKFN